jgi:hypothetical protein
VLTLPPLPELVLPPLPLATLPPLPVDEPPEAPLVSLLLEPQATAKRHAEPSPIARAVWASLDAEVAARVISTPC